MEGNQEMANPLEVLRARVERWRAQGGQGRRRIPEDLWNAAVEVARTEGVYAASRAARFEYNKLKGRVALARRDERDKGEGATFVELGGASLGGGGNTVVEIAGRRGGRMRIDVSGPCGLDIVGLAQAFWRHEA